MGARTGHGGVVNRCQVPPGVDLARLCDCPARVVVLLVNPQLARGAHRFVDLVLADVECAAQLLGGPVQLVVQGRGVRTLARDPEPQSAEPASAAVGPGKRIGWLRVWWLCRVLPSPGVVAQMWPAVTGGVVVERGDLVSNLTLCLPRPQTAESGGDVDQDADGVDPGVLEEHVQRFGLVQHHRPEEVAGQPGLLGRQAGELVSGHAPSIAESPRPSWAQGRTGHGWASATRCVSCGNADTGQLAG